MQHRAGKGHVVKGLVAALAVIFCLAGCGAVSALLDTQRALRDAGYSGGLNVNDTNGFSTATADVTSTKESADPDEVATIVWRTYPRRIDSIDVILNGDPSAPYARSAMLELAGPRPAGYDDKTFGDDAKGVVIGAVIGIGVGFVALLAIVVLIVVLVVRNRRKRQAQAVAYYPQPWGAQPPGPAPWSAQPPAPSQPPPPTSPGWPSPPPSDGPR